MKRDPEVLNEKEAVRLWQRAAELQAEAVHKSEDLAETPESGGTDLVESEGYALAHVRAAALEAGIGAEFVDAALADLRADRALPQPKRGRRLARWFLSDPPETIVVRRVIEAAPTQVFSAMQAVFPEEHYRLTLKDQRGDPLDGGVLTFEIQGYGAAFPQGLAAESGWAGYREVLVSVRPVESDTSACEVTLRAPVARAHNFGLMIGGVATLLGSGGGAALVVGVAVTIGSLASVLPGIALAAGGALAGGGLVMGGFRKVWRYGTARGRRALEGLLGAIAARAQGGWGVSSGESEPPPALPGASSPID